MLSLYPNPPPDQHFSHFHAFLMGAHPINLPWMQTDSGNLPPLGNLLDDPTKKIRNRKPYTITKSRESWTEQEHDKFLDALHLFDRDWKKIEAFVGSKTVIQIRSHAQKYFLKVQKNGTSEHVPPPRPKRKAAHPYPQKASKNAVSQAAGASQSSAACLESRYATEPNLMSLPGNQMVSAPLPWTYNVVPPGCLMHIQRGDIGLTTIANNYSSSSNEITPRLWTSNEAHRDSKPRQCNSTRVMPNFAQVYSFIGSVFDPAASDHMQRLKGMDPINVETVMMLMKNLAGNLASPQFEDHRRLLSSYNAGIENKSSSTGHVIPSVG